jgi:hypothetical protein
MRDHSRHPSIVTINHQTIDVDVDTDRGDSAAEDCIFPLARYRAVTMLDGRQREIRISSWRN